MKRFLSKYIQRIFNIYASLYISILYVFCIMYMVQCTFFPEGFKMTFKMYLFSIDKFPM